MTAAFSPGELATVPVTPLESAASLETLVINGPQPAPRAAFLTPGTAPWRLISEYAEPLLKHGTVVNLLLKD
jgi:hypothetical protein